MNLFTKQKQTHRHREQTYGYQWVNKEVKEEIRKYLKTNENGNTTFQNLWNAAKAVLRGKFIVIQAFLKKKEKSQTT